jgi:hypothetical protein
MTRQTIPLLSKSRFGAGLQCVKRLFLESYSREVADPIDPAQQAIFESGTAVGALARRRFPGGRLIKEAHYQHDRAVASTREALADRSVSAVYEAAFTYDDVRIRADVLARSGSDGLDLIEVKSSTSVKEEHIPDVAIQSYVLEGSGIALRRAFLLHINNEYVYAGGSYDLDKLFQLEDVTDDARAFVQASLPGALMDMREVLRREDTPPIEIGRQCNRPYRCGFYGHCREGSPEHHVEQLPRVSDDLLDQLFAAGIRDIGDIPAGFPGLSETQMRVRECVVSGRPYFDRAVSAALSRSTYPLYFLDFETFNPALPAYPGTRPYQLIPFQWSLHMRDSGGDVRHLSFLREGRDDPREEFIASLLDAVGPHGTIVVYSSFERTVLNQLAEEFPSCARRLLELPGRMLDLLEVVRSNVYHPEFHGSYSIKAVLPALVPDMDYGDLEIQEGGHASVAFARMIAQETGESDRGRLKEALLAYCRRDTEAMIRIFDALSLIAAD